MAEKLEIKVMCNSCLGTGINPGRHLEGEVMVPDTGPCPSCAGLGKMTMSEIDFTAIDTDIKKILRRLKKIMDKLEVIDD